MYSRDNNLIPVYFSPPDNEVHGEKTRSTFIYFLIDRNIPISCLVDPFRRRERSLIMLVKTSVWFHLSTLVIQTNQSRRNDVGCEENIERSIWLHQVRHAPVGYNLLFVFSGHPNPKFSVVDGIKQLVLSMLTNRYCDCEVKCYRISRYIQMSWSQWRMFNWSPSFCNLQFWSKETIRSSES